MNRLNQKVAIALACSVLSINVPAAFAAQADPSTAQSTWYEVNNGLRNSCSNW